MPYERRTFSTRTMVLVLVLVLVLVSLPAAAWLMFTPRDSP
jgi:hypothetical protein